MHACLPVYLVTCVAVRNPGIRNPAYYFVVEVLVVTSRGLPLPTKGVDFTLKENVCCVWFVLDVVVCGCVCLCVVVCVVCVVCGCVCCVWLFVLDVVRCGCVCCVWLCVLCMVVRASPGSWRWGCVGGTSGGCVASASSASGS